MKKILFILLLLILCSFSVYAADKCEDKSTKKLYEYSIEYGRHPPKCPECDDPKYSVGEEWYKLVETVTYPKEPYGYYGDYSMDNYWTYQKQFAESLKPSEGVGKYPGSISITDAAANLADTKVFKESFKSAKECDPDYELPVPDIIEAGLYEEAVEEVMESVVEEEPEVEENVTDPCEEFRRDNSIKWDNDLKYTEEELNKEMFDAFDNYVKDEELRKEDKIGNIWSYLWNWGSDKQSNKVEAPRENEMLYALEDAYNMKGARLSPGDVFATCLKTTRGKIDEALFTCHNVLKWKGDKTRKNKDYLKKAESDLVYYTEQLEGMTPDAKQFKSFTARKQKLAEELEGMKVANKLYYTYLEDIRPNDNVGAWYHLFGTMSAGHRIGGTIARIAVWGEHIVLKAWPHDNKHDHVEQCWDMWASKIGNELRLAAKAEGFYEDY